MYFNRYRLYILHCFCTPIFVCCYFYCVITNTSVLGQYRRNVRWPLINRLIAAIALWLTDMLTARHLTNVLLQFLQWTQHYLKGKSLWCVHVRIANEYNSEYRIDRSCATRVSCR